jgi:manganese efflux pump family protein
VLPSLLVLGVIVAANNAAAAVALGAIGGIDRRTRVVLVFAVIETVVPLLGMSLGRGVADRVAGSAGWIAAVLLLLLGIWAIREGVRRRPTDPRLERAITAWGPLFALAIGLSLDNLLVGFGLGLRGHDPISVALVIGFFSGAFAWLGMTLGARTGHRWERAVKVAAGVLLVTLGVAVGLGWF